MIESFEVNCVVIGGGVSGLAIARSLSSKIDNIFLLEKNNYLGEETSSRNSEVIHAGIYYKKGSLKQKLSVRGKKLLYDYLGKKKIPHLKSGKFIVSSSSKESDKLDLIKENSLQSGVDDLFYDTNNFKKLYPFINAKEALFSPSTGIFDSHLFIQNLKSDFERNGGNVLLKNECKIVDIKDGLISIYINDSGNNIDYILKTKLVINCAGLNAVKINNFLSEDKAKFSNRYVKGDYYSYSGTEKINHLIYPIPTKDSLGIHVTMDLGGGVRFGPSAYEVNTIDYSIKKSTKLDFLNSIKKYWPMIKEDQIQPTYSGIRPKLNESDDFNVIQKEFGNNLFFSILGYESPGLTSSLALGEYVSDKILQDI